MGIQDRPHHKQQVAKPIRIHCHCLLCVLCVCELCVCVCVFITIANQKTHQVSFTKKTGINTPLGNYKAFSWNISVESDILALSTASIATLHTYPMHDTSYLTGRPYERMYISQCSQSIVVN